MIKNCSVCNNEYKTKPSHAERRKFCSYQCYWEIKKGEKHSVEHIARCSKAMKGKMVGSKNPSWKGDNVGYYGIHAWVRKMMGRPEYCEGCGIDDKRMYHWANISHKYLRELSDWWRLCVKCHKNYDLNKI